MVCRFSRQEVRCLWREISLLRRFCGDEFSVRAENGDFAAEPREGSTLLGQYGLPIRTSWPYSHLLYEHPKDGIERNIPGRQVSVPDFRASDLCSLPEVQMWS